MRALTPTSSPLRMLKRSASLIASSVLHTGNISKAVSRFLSDERGMWGLPAQYGQDAPPSYIKSIQKVSIIVSNSTSNTATIASVNTSNTVIFFASEETDETSALEEVLVRVTLTNSTTVTATLDTAPHFVDVRVTVVEFVSSAVAAAAQYGTITLGSGDTSNTASISSVNTSYAAIFYLGVSNSAPTFTTGLCNIALTSSTVVTATRSTAGSTAVVGYCVIEFASSIIKSIQHRSVTLTSANTSDTDTISSVNTGYTMLLYGGLTTASSTSPQNAFYNLVLTNGTTVTLSRNGTTTATRTIKYVVVEFMPWLLRRTVQRGTITLNGVQENTATITAVSSRGAVANSLLNSSPQLSVNANRSFIKLVLTNSTTLTASSNMSAGNAAVVSYEVIDFA